MEDFNRFLLSVVILIAIVMVISVSSALIQQNSKINLCRDNDGEYAMKDRCLINGTIYEIVDTSEFNFFPEYKIGKLGVSKD